MPIYKCKSCGELVRAHTKPTMCPTCTCKKFKQFNGTVYQCYSCNSLQQENCRCWFCGSMNTIKTQPKPQTSLAPVQKVDVYAHLKPVLGLDLTPDSIQQLLDKNKKGASNESNTCI